MRGHRPIRLARASSSYSAQPVVGTESHERRRKMTLPRGALTEGELQTRLARVRELMSRDGYDLDALIVTSPENIYYLIGLTHQGYFAFTMLVLPREGQPSLLTRSIGGIHDQPTSPRCRPHRVWRRRGGGSGRGADAAGNGFGQGQARRGPIEHVPPGWRVGGPRGSASCVQRSTPVSMSKPQWSWVR